MARWLPRFRRAPRPAAAGGPGAAGAPSLRIESRAITHRGRVRDHNEDGHVARDSAGLWAVADGMGGHEGGEWAAARLVAELGEVAPGGDLDSALAAAEAAVARANQAIFAEAGARGRQMGSTIALMVARGGDYAVSWCGDSRAYRLRGGGLVRLSRDHSQIEEMVARGLMTPAQAIGHPMGHILSRAVGVEAEAELDRVTGAIEPGDVFLLCSDGLHGVVGDAEIGAELGRSAPAAALDGLLALALARGAPDNVTAVAIWASEPTLLAFADSPR